MKVDHIISLVSSVHFQLSTVIYVLNNKDCNWLIIKVNTMKMQTKHNQWICQKKREKKKKKKRPWQRINPTVLNLCILAIILVATEVHPCSTVVSGRKGRRKPFPIEAAEPILIVIIWSWVTSLDVIISCQTKKKLNCWKM